MPSSARAALESLLRVRKLDSTLSTAFPLTWPDAGERLVSTGIASLDATLGGGLPRGQISEIVGVGSTGRTALVQSLLAGVTGRGELAALVDTLDRFDPPSAIPAGVARDRLLWVRGEEAPDVQMALDPAWEPSRARPGQPRQTPMARALGRAIKAVSLVLSAGGFGLVVLDVADVPRRVLEGLPYTTWLRLQRMMAASDTACVVVAGSSLARSTGGRTIRLAPRVSAPPSPLSPPPPREAERFHQQVVASRRPLLGQCSPGQRSPGQRSAVAARPGSQALWVGESDAARQFRGLAIDVQVQSGIQTAACTLDLTR